jgi:hypothetical protein
MDRFLFSNIHCHSLFPCNIYMKLIHKIGWLLSSSVLSHWTGTYERFPLLTEYFCLLETFMRWIHWFVVGLKKVPLIDSRVLFCNWILCNPHLRPLSIWGMEIMSPWQTVILFYTILLEAPCFLMCLE